MKTKRIVKGNNNVTFEIVEEDDETPERLALILAESLNSKAYYERQIFAFRTQMQNERLKATEIVTTLYQLKEYNREKKLNPGRKVSRMEPMETYDAEMLEEEKKEFLRRANDFHEKVDMYEDLVKAQDRKIKDCQRKLKQANNGSA